MVLKTRDIFTACFFIVCVLSTIDTHGFVYPSLSRSLLTEAGWLVLSLIIGGYCCTNKKRICIGTTEIFVCSFICYIFLHGMICGMERYKATYLCIGLWGIIVISQALKLNIIKRDSIYHGLLVILLLHILYIILEGCGIITSGNPYFKITGANENPNVTAIYMAGCMPILIYESRQGKHKKAVSLLLLVTVLTVVILQCRTAYIGIFVSAAAILFVRKKITDSVNRHKRECSIGFLIATITIVTLGFTAYKAKKDSADGRILIWKISSKMIVDKPEGVGYGLFEKSYNLKQAEYFRNKQGIEKEQRNATYTAMAFNDFLEHGVEGGIAGLVMYATFFIMIIVRARKYSANPEFPILTALATMSIFNFVYTGVQSWFMIACVAGIVTSKNIGEKHKLSVSKTLLGIAVLSFYIGNVIRAQTRLNKLQKTTIPINDSEFERIANAIGTSEAFWRLRAKNALSNDKPREAYKYYNAAFAFTSKPQILIDLYYCTVLLGKEDEGIAHIETYSLMCPYRLLPKAILMRYFARKKKFDKAQEYADGIIYVPQKVLNQQALELKKEATMLKMELLKGSDRRNTYQTNIVKKGDNQ